MVDEQSRRRTEFESGVDVRLSDGQCWTLPVPEGPPGDLDLIALYKAIAEAEDRHERLRLELALTISLLRKNYELSANEIGLLLQFSQGDVSLIKLQEDLRNLSTRILMRLDKGNSPINADHDQINR